MTDLLLVLWIAFIGADRIDLAGGHGPFILTPFLVLTPVLVLSAIIRRAMEDESLMISVRAMGYAAFSTALLCVAITSAVLAQQVPNSAARAMLLVADVLGTFAVAMLCFDRRNFSRLLAVGAIGSLVLFVACDVGEVLYWIGRAPEIVRLGPASLKFGELQSLGLFPRLPGAVGDANRAGFILVCYAFFIAFGEPRAWLRRSSVALTMLLLLLPFSRSAAMAAVAAGGVALISRRRNASLEVATTLAVLSTLLIVGFLAQPRAVGKYAAILSSPLASHLSANEPSAQSHITLIDRGIDEGLSSIPRMAIGLGYGDGYLVLQDIFPGNRYGNFHSLYVTMFAEAGVFALLLVLVLMGTPLFLGGPWRPLVAGAMAFNVFYQTTTEPLFWFVLAVAWLTIPATAPRADPQRESLPPRLLQS